jgi:hypothetical protein
MAVDKHPCLSSFTYMSETKSFSESEIQAEYERLGHSLGWRLLTCPARNIESSSVALITSNPGGSIREPPKWSVEDGSAYVIESWKSRPPGKENLQRQVRRMCEVMMLHPEDVLSGYFVPFRSQRWQQLPKKAASIQFGTRIWRDILHLGKVTTAIAFGKSDIGPYVARIFDATANAEVPTGWGDQTISVYRFGLQGKLLLLPHLSTFKLFSAEKYESAFRTALGRG